MPPGRRPCRSRSPGKPPSPPPETSPEIPPVPASVQIGLTRIPSRSRRQTMDWALVLASQNIEAVIDQGAAGNGWGLVVSAADQPAAAAAIAQYTRENRHWRWPLPLAASGVIFDWRILFWSLLLITVHFMSQKIRPDLAHAGCMNNAAVRAGEWWRLFSAILLHADMGHLAGNLVFGTLLLGLVLGRYGTGIGLLAAWLAGAGGNVAGLLFYPATHLGLGASGMVMGGVGLLAAQTVVRRAPGGWKKPLLKGLGGGVLLLAMLAFSPESDVVAHLGGFFTGLALGMGLMQLPARWKNFPVNLTAGLAFAALLLLTSWLAFL